MMKSYFKLFAHNIPVAGKEKSAIYNLQQNDLILIPTILYDILTVLEKESIVETQLLFSPNNPDLFQEYIDFLLQKDVGFLTDSPEKFLKLDLSWDSPHHIINAIIERNDDSRYDFTQLIQQLDSLLCKHLELRFLQHNLDENKIGQLLQTTDSKTFRTITLFLEASEHLTEQALLSLYNNFPKIDQIFVFNSPCNKILDNSPIFLTDASVEETLEQAKTIDKPFVNIDYFLEAQNFNPFYNRKVSITADGAIKNDLILKESYGNIENELLSTVVQSTSFQTLWHAKPDTIKELKDSPLRYAIGLAFPLKQLDANTFSRQLNTKNTSRFLLSLP